MKDIIAWLENNREWVFSGVGVVAISGFYTLFFRHSRSDAEKVKQNATLTQSPNVTQAPIVNITNNVEALNKSQPHVAIAIPKSLFALNPQVALRDLMAVTGSSLDDAVEVCVARFKLHDGAVGWIPQRFEVSVNYIERLSASGFPYEHHAGHVNQARWLEENNGVHELILILNRSSIWYAVSDSTHVDSWAEGEGSLLQLNTVSTKTFATVTLTDTTNGEKWRAEYAIEFSGNGSLTVRETSVLRRL
jgi:hypothetical protein